MSGRLQPSFDGADREYVDGEVLERNMGEAPHAMVQTRLGHLLVVISEALPIVVLTDAD